MIYRRAFFSSFFLFIACFLFGQAEHSFAQPNSSNNLQVTVATTPSFTLNTTTLLENAQVLSNALILNVKTGRNTCHVYGSIPAGITTTSSTAMPVGNVILVYNHTTSDASHFGGATSGDIVMTTSGQLLFWAKPTATQYAYYFDVKVPAIGYNYNSGTYNYTFQFTMTQP